MDTGPKTQDDLTRHGSYEEYFKDTIETAAQSYRFHCWLGAASFVLGAVLLCLLIAAIPGIIGTPGPQLRLVIAGLATVNLVVLFLYRPSDRIQSAVVTLIKLKIVCLSFGAQYDSVVTPSTKMQEQELKSLREAASQAIVDLIRQPEYVMTTIQSGQTGKDDSGANRTDPTKH